MLQHQLQLLLTLIFELKGSRIQPQQLNHTNYIFQIGIVLPDLAPMDI